MNEFAEMLVYIQASRVYEDKHEPRPGFLPASGPHGCLINQHFGEKQQFRFYIFRYKI